MQKLTFPVLIFNERFIEGIIFNPIALQKVTIKSVKKKIYENLTVIYYESKKFKVLSYRRRIHWYVLLSNFITAPLTLFMRPFDDYGTWVEFELSDPEKITFEEVKAEILALVKKNPRWFKKSHENFKTIEEKLASYKSLQDMIEKLAGYS